MNMRYSVKSLLGFAAMADDGECGKVHDVLFDDSTWKICYLVLRSETGNACSYVQVPYERFHSPDIADGTVRFEGTRELAWSENHFENDPPVSRRLEMTRSALQSLSAMYEPDYSWGALPVFPIWPFPVRKGSKDNRISNSEESVRANPHLRSSREVIGYRVQSPNGKAGRVVDIFIDEVTNAVQLFLVETHRFWHRANVPLLVRHVRGICWSLMRVSVDLDKKEFKSLIPLVRS
jgi:hypothetical protein